MKKKIKIIFIILMIGIFASQLYAGEVTRTKLVFIIIDDAGPGKDVAVGIASPEKFRPLQEGETSSMLEFVPLNDKDDYKWSEIFTMFDFPKKHISAKTITKEIMHHMLHLGGPKAKILHQDSFKTKNGLEQSEFTISYEENGRSVVMVARYYSGSINAAGVQYAKVYTDDKSMLKAQKDIIAYLDDPKNVFVLDF